MLEVGVIGLGNTGNQIAALAHKELKIPAIAINSSETDLESVADSGIPRKLIKDADKMSAGAGKDRKLAKKYLKDSIMSLMKDEDILTMVKGLDIVYVISSTGGGTGSGTAPVLADIIGETFRDTKCILIGVLPVNSEGYSSHVNTLQYLDELYNKLNSQTYILYDNDKLSHLGSSYKILQTVNEEVVKDIDVMRCSFNFQTRFDSIDDRDMIRLLSFPGRIMISRLEGFQEKDCDNQTIEDMIIDNIKKNTHVESQRDKKVMATGIITNLSAALNEEFDNNVLTVRSFVGDPVHAFVHTYMNEDRKLPNNVFFIATGLTPINDKINKISDRVDEIEAKQKILEEENAIGNVDLSSLSDKITDKDTRSEADEVNLKDIFGKFDM